MIRVPLEELKIRIDRIKQMMEKRKLDGLYITNTTTFKYLLDYYYIQTERPAAILIDKNADIFFLGPMLEKDHVLIQTPLVKESYGYPDYPGEKHPLKYFSEWINRILKGKRLGTDNMSLYPEYMGFRGISINTILPGFELIDLHRELYDMRKIKSPVEQDLLRESAKWGNLAHRLLQKYTEPGKYDFEIGARAATETGIILMETFGLDFKPAINYPLEIEAGFRGQVGEHSYYPHSLSINRKLKIGDILGSGAAGNLDSYHIEIERNMFLGEPDDRTAKFHRLAVEMQQTAFQELKVGKKFSDIDKAVIRFAKKNDVLKYRMHHTGHNIGLDGHESPFFDVGDNSIIEDGMVFSLEPGIYVPKLGGFRHSDTVIMHEGGPEMITYYPNDTEALTVIP
ncbi:MAG: Xaa-Pro peptidase family protein [Thermoplasmatales archaeon]